MRVIDDTFFAPALRGPMRVRLVTLFAIILGAALFSTACGSTTTAPSALASISVAGAAPVIGAVSQLTATGTLADGNTEDVTATASWTSSDPSVATVSATGAVTGVTAGTASVFATIGNVSGTLAVVVN